MPLLTCDLSDVIMTRKNVLRSLAVGALKASSSMLIAVLIFAKKK